MSPSKSLGVGLAPGPGSIRLGFRLTEMPKQGRNRSIRALERAPGAEYDEETFLYFLSVERARAQRANLKLWLLLATLEPADGKPVPIPRASASKLFDGLRQSLRDTDIMGWYRQDRVVGAVLSARADAPEQESSDLIEQRVGEGLRKRLPSTVARTLRVRVTQHGPRRIEKKTESRRT